MKNWTKKKDEKRALKEMIREGELNGSDGWELIPMADYQSHTPEEIEQMKNKVEENIQKAIDNL